VKMAQLAGPWPRSLGGRDGNWDLGEMGTWMGTSLGQGHSGRGQCQNPKPLATLGLRERWRDPASQRPNFCTLSQAGR
jgi:hypothetical protein